MPPSVQQAQGALTAFQGSQKSANDILNSAMSQYGVQGAQTTKNNLETTLNNTTAALNALPAQVQGRTSRSLVTQAQLGGITNEEAAPIREALTGVQGEYNTASNNYQDLSGKATTLANAELGQQTEKEQELEQNYKDAADQAAQQLAAQQEAQKLAEQQREFNTTSSQNAAKLAADQSAAAQSRVDSANSGMASELQKVVGGDGYVSPDSYAKAKKAYEALGFSASQFDSTFAGYRNPNNKYYKIG